MELIVELVITEACNLACSYCYMANRQVTMTPDQFLLFQQNVGTVMQRYRKNRYHVTFFGGEPLLNWDLIKYALPLLNADVRCSSKMVVTNAMLLDEEKATFLSAHDCGLSVSFDGLWNDGNRPLKGGAPSLPAYLKKRDLFKKLKIHGCKVMVGPTSVPTMVENYNFLVDEFDFMNPDFSLVRDDIWTWEDVSAFSKNLPLLADAVISRFERGQSAGVGFFTLMLMDVFIAAKRGKRPMGCFAGCEGVAFLPDGIFYPCARYGSEKKYPLFDANVGASYDSNIDFLQTPAVCNPIAYETCKGCDIRLFCNGGCNKSFLEKGGGLKAEPIPQLCELYKAIFEETMRIHKALRDNATYRTYVAGLMASHMGMNS